MTAGRLLWCYVAWGLDDRASEGQAAGVYGAVFTAGQGKEPGDQDWSDKKLM